MPQFPTQDNRQSHPFDRAVSTRIEAWRREVLQQMLVPFPNDKALDAILDRIYSGGTTYEVFEFLGSFALLNLPANAIALMVDRIASRFRDIDIARLEKPAPAPAAPAAATSRPSDCVADYGTFPKPAQVDAAGLIQQLQAYLQNAIGLARQTSSPTFLAWAEHVQGSDLLKPFPG